MLTEIPVDKAHPGPNSSRYEANKYPWEKLDAPKEHDGKTLYDSFFVPGKTTKQFGAIVWQAAKRLGMKFATKTVTENGVQGTRVWRVQ
jgi:hypothetical protein